MEDEAKTCTKKEIIRAVAERTGFDAQTVKDVTQAVFDIMCEGLAQDGNIEIRNFGIFKIKHTATRKARNPKTSETITVGPKTLIHFKPGQYMKELINRQVPLPSSGRRVEESNSEEESTPSGPGIRMV